MDESLLLLPRNLLESILLKPTISKLDQRFHAHHIFLATNSPRCLSDQCTRAPLFIHFPSQVHLTVHLFSSFISFNHLSYRIMPPGVYLSHQCRRLIVLNIERGLLSMPDLVDVIQAIDDVQTSTMMSHVRRIR